MIDVCDELHMCDICSESAGVTKKHISDMFIIDGHELHTYDMFLVNTTSDVFLVNTTSGCF